MATIYQRYLEAKALQKAAKEKRDASAVARARSPSKTTKLKKLIKRKIKEGTARDL